MPFTYERTDGDPAGRAGDGTELLAGGTDLLTRYKVGLADPEHVVDIKTSDLPAGIERVDGGWRIGALATLAEIEDHEELAADLPMIGDAVAQAATRQLRHRATVGGNLLQQPRCRYYRSEDMTCWFAGADTCPARDGRNEHHAVFQTGTCVAVQPSDLASALVAADATVAIRGDRHRSIAVADLLAPPTDDRRALHVLRTGEVVESVTVPAVPGRRSSYRKAMNRSAWEFALAGVAVVVGTDDDGRVEHASVVASGVAATPWRLTASEDALRGRALDDDAIAAAADAATDGAEPLAENRYKLTLLRGLVQRSLHDLCR